MLKQDKEKFKIPKKIQDMILMGEDNELKNRYLHIAWEGSVYSEEKQPIKQPIEKNSPFIILEMKSVLSRTKANIIRLYGAFGNEKVFETFNNFLNDKKIFVKHLISVDFPAPLNPIIPKTSPLFTVKETSSIALIILLFNLNSLTKFFTLIMNFPPYKKPP